MPTRDYQWGVAAGRLARASGCGPIEGASVYRNPQFGHGMMRGWEMEDAAIRRGVPSSIPVLVARKRAYWATSTPVEDSNDEE